MNHEQIASRTTQSLVSAENGKERKLLRRDWILLPLLGGLTICMIAGSAEWISRRTFSGSETSVHDCMIIDDTSTGARGIPNSVCWVKLPEGRLAEYKFNELGHRAGMEREPKPADVFRIVMTGTSTPMGMGVPREQSFAALLPSELSRKTGKRIELYNESIVWMSPRVISLRLNDLLAARPDLILWVLTPGDIKAASLLVPDRQNWNDAGNRSPVRAKPLSLTERLWNRLKGATVKGGVRKLMLEFWNEHRTSVLMEHYLYESQKLYVESYLRRGDEDAGFLRAEPSAAWQSDLQKFNRYAADIVDRVKQAGVPIVVVLVPQRAQAAMISEGVWPEGYDPYKLDKNLRSTVINHGGTYIDILPDFRNVPNPEQYYYPVDGHPNASGHAILADRLAIELTNGSVPALRTAGQTQFAFEKGK